jgi:hypothetical protein
MKKVTEALDKLSGKPYIGNHRNQYGFLRIVRRNVDYFSTFRKPKKLN